MSSTSLPTLQENVFQSPYFHSRRIKKGEVDRPWMGKKNPKDKFVDWAPYVGMFVGVAAAGIIIWNGLRTSITNSKYCQVYLSDFGSGVLDSSIWTKEVEVGGFG